MLLADISKSTDLIFRNSITIKTSTFRISDTSDACNSTIHDYTQMCYTLSGSLKINIDGKAYIHSPGSCSLVPPYTPHILEPHNSSDTPIAVYIKFYDSFMHRFGYDLFTGYTEALSFENRSIPIFRMLNENDRSAADEYIRSMRREYSKASEADPGEIAKLFAQFLRLLCTQPFDGNTSVKRKHFADITASVRYISDNLSEKLTIDKLASAAMMSRVNYTKNFKLITGMTVQQFILTLRLSRTSREIGFSTMTLDEIAALVGVCDKTYLSTLFSNHFGISPSEYRKSVADNSVVMEQHTAAIRRSRREDNEKAKNQKQETSPL